MSNKNLVTQGETASTSTGLGSLADNLNEHVNASMSKAHGWTLIPNIYLDSGGCAHTSPIVAGASAVARVVIGSKVFFVPVQLSGGQDSVPDPVIPPSTGVVSPQSANPQDDITVGSPTQTALVTAFAAALNAVSSNASNLLFSHAGAAPEQVHGGLSWQSEKTFDDAAHVVGHQTINILVGGVAYKLIGDTNLGITQLPSVTASCPQVVAVQLFGGNFFQNAPCSWEDRNPGGWQGASQFVLELVVNGSLPIKYQWQISTNPNDPNGWINIAPNSTYSGNAGFHVTILASGANAGPLWVTSAPNGTVNAAATHLRIALWDSGSHNNTTNLAYAIRLKLDNSALTDGGIVTSGVFILAMQDVPGTGC